MLLNITQTYVKKSSNYGSLQFQAWICTIFHGRNLYDFQRSKRFSKLHLLYLYALSKQSFPNYSNTRRSSPRISRSWNNCILLWIANSGNTTKSLISEKNCRILWNWWVQCHPQILNIDFGLVLRDSYVIACAREERVWKIENKKYSKCQYETIFYKKNRRPATTWNNKKSAILKDKKCFQALIMEHAHY